LSPNAALSGLIVELANISGGMENNSVGIFNTDECCSNLA
jgi:hypothetical protein